MRLLSTQCRWTSGRWQRRARPAWVDYARAVLEGYGLDDDEPVDEANRFRGRRLVPPASSTSGRAVAKRGGEFKWSTELDLEEVEYLVHAFYRVAGRANAAAEARGRSVDAARGEAFYTSLVPRPAGCARVRWHTRRRVRRGAPAVLARGAVTAGAESTPESARSRT